MNESIKKDIYNRILDERIDEILKISREINFNNFIYKFKTPAISSINFIKFKGPMYTNNQLRKWQYKIITNRERSAKIGNGISLNNIRKSKA